MATLRWRPGLSGWQRHPFAELEGVHREMNRLFDDLFEVSPFMRGDGGGVFPEIDVKETDKEIKVSAEVPGLDEKDVEVLLTHDSLTIKGEKKEEKEEKGESYYRSERRYGSFCRVIPLTTEVDSDKAEAKFSKGVLHVTIPKTERARADVKKIPIKH